MKSTILALVAAVFVTGCVSTKTIPMDTASVVASQPQTVTVSQRATPDFAAMTATRGALGVFGAAAMVSEGNKLIEAKQVRDPAGYIGNAIAETLASQMELRQVDLGVVGTETRKASELAQEYSQADLLVDVETVNWNFSYFPTQFTKYRVVYNAKLRIIDTRSEAEVAGGYCHRVMGEPNAAPSYEELLANEAQLLKEKLQRAADECIDEFQKTVLEG